jgi:tetratricopeptide (TPR) repeat protein
MDFGHNHKTVGEMERALNEDPINLLGKYQMAVCLLAMGRDADGFGMLREIVELDENLFPAYEALARYYVSREMFAEALGAAKKAHSLAPRFMSATGMLAALLLRNGEKDRAEELLRTLEPGDAYGAPVDLCTFYLVSGDAEKAADWLAKAIEQRYPSIPIMLALVPSVRSGPRWPTLARMMNWPEAG